MRQTGKLWYVTAGAALYLVLCSISCVRYAATHLRTDAATVPVAVQLLCLGLALSAAVYFIRPRAGHRGLIFFTVGTLVAVGTSDPEATCFHLVMLCILLAPYLRGWAHPNSRRGPQAFDSQ